MYEIEGSKNFMCPDWDAQEAYQVKDFELKSVVKLKDFVLQDCKDNLEGWIEYMKKNGVSHDFNPYLYNDLVVEGCTITHKDENGMIDGQIDVDVSYDLPEKSVSDLTVEDFKIQVEFNYRPLNKDFLRSLVRDCRVDLGDIDTSKITDMSNLFLSTNFAENLRENSTYKGIEKWNTSSVTNMNYMFANCVDFNQNINSWNVSSVKNMSGMFFDCINFNQPLNDWNVSLVKDMAWMFAGCEDFNQPLNDWYVPLVYDMHEMFKGCKAFNQPLNDWSVRDDCICNNAFIGSNLSYANLKDAFTEEQLKVCGSPKIIDALNNEKKQAKVQEQKQSKGRGR